MVWENTLKKITENTALLAALLWVDHPKNLRLINNQINCVYRFESSGVGFYLRMTHEQIRPKDELLAALNFQKHLFLNDAPVCEAIPSRHGILIESVDQDNLQFLTQVCKEVPGQIMNFDSQNKEAYVLWGQALAKLHKASMSYQAKSHWFRNWCDLWQETANYIQNEEECIQEAYYELNERFSNLTANTLNYGLTHGDHRPGNVLYDGKKIHFIDFDEPVYHWFMADIAKPFLDLCNTAYDVWEVKFKWFLEGYRMVLPIDDTLLQSINDFSQMKSLDIYLWCKNNWFESTAPGAKPREQWLNELRHMALAPLFK